MQINGIHLYVYTAIMMFNNLCSYICHDIRAVSVHQIQKLGFCIIVPIVLTHLFIC